jgi:hypothetical protein
MTTPPVTKRIQCQQCFAEARIPADADPHAINICGCCLIDHHHGQAAAACSGNEGAGHPGAACPHPNPLACTRVTPHGEECPGGHCGIGVDGCTVCRPLIHFAEAGDVFETVAWA